MNTRVFRIKAEIEAGTYDEIGGLEKALPKVLAAIEALEEEAVTPTGAAI